MTTTHTSRTGTFPEEGIKAPCVVSTSANITLSGEQTIGSTAVVAGDRVLVRSQTDTKENGIWVCAVGAWTRPTDWEDDSDVVAGVLVSDGANSTLYKTVFTGSFVAGTTEVTFEDMSASNALLKASATSQTVTSDVVFQGSFEVNGDGTYNGSMDFDIDSSETLRITVATADNIKIDRWYVLTRFKAGYNTNFTGIDDVTYNPNSDDCAIDVLVATATAGSAVDTKNAGRFRMPIYTNVADANSRCGSTSDANKKGCFGFNEADGKEMVFDGTNWVLSHDPAILAS